MPDVSFDNLLVVCLVAAAAPLALGFAPRLRLPAVVLEILAGVVLGPSVLGWVEVDLPVQVTALVGLAFLLFLSGLEIDVHRLHGPLLRLAVLGYLLSLVIGLTVGFGLAGAGWVQDPLLLAISLSATSLGLVVPVLKDAGHVEGQVGQTVVVAATVADFAAIVLLSLLFSTSEGSTGSRLVLAAGFAVLVGATAALASRAGRSMRLGDVLLRLQDTTAEVRVRLAVVLLVAFTALAEHVGLESILGAFLAGVVVSAVDRDSASHPYFRTKLEALGYGFLVPVFFVSSGVRLDLAGLLSSPAALLRVPVLLGALLLVRGLPALLYLRTMGHRPAMAAGLLEATSLPFIVAAAMIGTELGVVSAVTAAALVSAGLLSVLLFPAAALTLLRGAGPRSQDGAARTDLDGRYPAPVEHDQPVPVRRAQDA